MSKRSGRRSDPENALSSSGGAGTPISNTAGETKPAARDTAGRSPKPASSGRSARDSSWPTPHDALAIFQEDLRVLARVGVKVSIVPEVPTIGCPAVLLFGVRLEDGNLVLAEEAA